jgi:hypothetical protein
MTTKDKAEQYRRQAEGERHKTAQSLYGGVRSRSLASAEALDKLAERLELSSRYTDDKAICSSQAKLRRPIVAAAGSYDPGGLVRAPPSTHVTTIAAQKRASLNRQAVRDPIRVLLSALGHPFPAFRRFDMASIYHRKGCLSGCGAFDRSARTAEI